MQTEFSRFISGRLSLGSGPLAFLEFSSKKLNILDEADEAENKR